MQPRSYKSHGSLKRTTIGDQTVFTLEFSLEDLHKLLGLQASSHEPLDNRQMYWNCSCRGHTSWLHIGFILRVLSTGHLQVLYSDHLLGATVLILCIYMRPVACQVDYYQATQAIQSILCCAYITTTVVIFIKMKTSSRSAHSHRLAAQIKRGRPGKRH